MSNQENTPDQAAEAVEPSIPEEALEDTPAADEPSETQPAAVADDEILLKLQQQAQAYSEGWQRERADFANYKKRAERDLLTMRFNAKIDTLKALLPILDDFERAMSSIPEEMQGQAWLEGIEAIQRKLLRTLENEGIHTLDPVGEPFDPNMHEAIGHDSDTDIESGHVTVTLQKGYVCGDRVLRPALVKVAE